MKCARAREWVSAGLDGELDDDQHSELAEHLAACPACAAYAVRAGQLHRSMRISAMPEIPDLVPAIMARAKPPAMFPLLIRYSLLILGLVGLAIALPELWTAATAEHAHAASHLGGWDAAFAIGLIVAAVQPARARGLLPMALALGGFMIITAAIDVGAGRTSGMAESTHVLELVDLVLLWLLVRQQPHETVGGRRHRHSGPSPTIAPTGQPSLRVLRSPMMAARAKTDRRHAA